MRRKLRDPKDLPRLPPLDLYKIEYNCPYGAVGGWQELHCYMNPQKAWDQLDRYVRNKQHLNSILSGSEFRLKSIVNGVVEIHYAKEPA